MKKDELVTIKIQDMSAEGLGIGKADGYTLFVKDAVIGDVAEVKIMKMKKNYGFARLMTIKEPSKDRVKPLCPVARQCGGCQIQAVAYKTQLKFKENLIENHLKRIGGFTQIPMEPIVGMENPYRYRNKAQFPIGIDKEGNLRAGFFAGRTHTIIPVEDCLLGVKENKTILNKVLSFMKTEGIAAYDETNGKGLVRHVLIRYGFFTKEIMVCLIINGKKLPNAEKLVESLRQIPGMTSITINSNESRTNVILGDTIKLLWGQTYITDTIGEISYQISPLSFYQVNPVQTEKLYQIALEYANLTGEETVWDLYCGIGTISLFLAQKAKHVYGVEIVPDAIRDAKKNAQRNGITNAEFFVGKAEEVLPEKYEKEGIKADVIVVDPPRKGCDKKLLETIVKMQPKRIVYVSCDSATLARDLKWMCERGYELKRVRGIDQFGQTVHVETVALLSKLKTDKHIDVELDMDEFACCGE